MKPSTGFRLTREMVVRMIADVLLVNAALLGAIVFWYISKRPVMWDWMVMRRHLDLFLNSSWILTSISLGVFWLNGFYTHGRIYQGRYKALTIVQAVSLCCLVFGFLVLLAWDATTFPRALLLVVWGLLLVSEVGVRLWPIFWRTFLRLERRLHWVGPAAGEIENVLIIGGAGYIGSALVEQLLELGYRVRVLDLLVYGDDSIARFYGHPDFELIRGDLRKIDTVVQATKGMDAVVHLGAIVGDSACSIDEDTTVEINLRATKMIAEVSKGFGVRRLIFASTCSVYGASDEFLTERSTLCPLSLYARTKVESEKVLLGLADSSFAPTILRFGTVYGLSGRTRFDLVVNLLTAKAIQEGQAGIFGGKQWRPLVHVKDVARAITLTLQSPAHGVCGQILNVGSNEQNCQIADLGPMIKEMVPSAQVVVQPQEDNRNYRVRFDKIQNVLGFRPLYTVRDGIQEIIDSFAAGRIVDYRDPRYNNFQFLKQNGDLGPLFMGDEINWAWAHVSATDAAMLAAVVMAVVQSRNGQLVDRLPDGLVQAILGDVDGCLHMLTGIQLAPSTELPASYIPAGQPVLIDAQPADLASKATWAAA